MNWEELVDQFNDEKDVDKQFTVKTNKDDVEFEFITKFSLYTRAAENSPDWGRTLVPLVTDLHNINNISHSYLLFLEVDEDMFAVTGGSGYQVISNDKEYDFGIQLLSRLIDPNATVIKRVRDRYFSGNILDGDYQLKGKGTINSETNFNNYFDEIYISLDSTTIRTKLGISIPSRKTDYRFLAKDSIKLGKALTLNELDNLLGAILTLLQEPGYSINPFYQIHKKDSIVYELEEKLVNAFMDYVYEVSGNNDLYIVPLDQECEDQFIEIKEIESSHTHVESDEEISAYIKEHFTFPNEPKPVWEILNAIKSTSITGAREGEEIVEINLYAQIDVKVTKDNNVYWLMDGDWYFLDRVFIEEIDQRFRTKVTEGFDLDFTIESRPLNVWRDVSEGEFNFGHNVNESIYVLDKILYQNIEICDLLVETDDSLYFVHVKDGLDGNVRTLSDQIIHAMSLLNHRSLAAGYYKSITDKITSPTEGNESDLSLAARKFKRRFQTERSFYDAIGQKEIHFVFAYRPLASHDFFDPSMIGSSAAKLSMINLVEERNKYDYPLEFLEIERG